MLSDRKFFYPVDSSIELSPINRKRNFTRWRPIGPDAFVVMDRSEAFVGEHAPRVHPEGSDAPRHGASRLTLRRGRRCAEADAARDASPWPAVRGRPCR